MNKPIWVIIHHHRHGTSVHIVRSKEEPDPIKAIRADGSIFDETDEEEHTEVCFGVQHDQILDLDTVQ